MNRNRRARDLDDRTVEALLAGRIVEAEPGLAALVAEARALTPAEAPAPSDALAAMLEHGVTPVAVPLTAPARRQRRSLQAAVAIGAALGLVVSAGAANALPGPVQNGVSDVVGWVSPLDLPRHGEQADDRPSPAPSPSRSGASEAGDDHGSATPEPGDGSGSRSPEPGDRSGSGGSDDGATPRATSGSSSNDGTVSGGSGSGSGGSDDSTTTTTAPKPTPTKSASPSPTEDPTTSSGGSGGSDDPTP